MDYKHDESALIADLLTRKEAAFRFAIAQYHAPMLYLARRIAGDKIADEVVQEAWMSVLAALPKFERRSSLKTWLLRIVANEAKSRLRREKRLVSIEDLTRGDPDLADRFDSSGHWRDEPTAWGASSPEALLSSEALKVCMDAVITALPDLQSATLALRDQQGMALADICNVLDVSESNVRVLLHRARNRLYKCVEHWENTGECCVDT